MPTFTLIPQQKNTLERRIRKTASQWLFFDRTNGEFVAHHQLYSRQKFSPLPHFAHRTHVMQDARKSGSIGSFECAAWIALQSPLRAFFFI